MSLRPTPIVDPRRDNSQKVEGGENVNTAGVRLRSELAAGESRHTFAIVLDDDTDTNQFVHSQPPLQSEQSRSLVYLEGYMNDIEDGVDPETALANNQGSWEPPADLNLITTLTATSFTEPCRINSYVDGNLQSVVYDSDPGWSFGQVAELSEFKEFVALLGGTLGGSHTIEWEVENLGPNPVRGSVIVRLLGKEVDQ